MALTGRAGLLALAGAARRRAARCRPGSGVLLVTGCCWSLLVAVDVALRRRRCARCALRRDGDTVGPARRAGDGARCASPTSAAPGARPCCATPGRPAPGPPTPAAPRSTYPPGERRRVDDRAAPDPARRPARATGSPCARSARSGWPAGRARTTCRGGCGCCRRSPRAGTCPRGWPGCASSTGATAVMVRGQGTEFDSLREYVVGDDVRSIDWRATARRGRRRWCAPGGRSATGGCCWCSTPAAPSAARVGDAPRLDAAMDAALLLAALASRAGDRVDLLAYDRRVRAPGRGRGRARPAAGAGRRRWRRSRPALVETDYAGHGRARCSPALAGAPGRAAHRAGPGPGRGGAAARARRRCVRRHQVVLASVADPRVGASWPPAAATPRRCTTPPPPSGPGPSGGGSAGCSAGAASRSSTARPATLAPDAGRPLPRAQGRRPALSAAPRSATRRSAPRRCAPTPRAGRRSRRPAPPGRRARRRRPGRPATGSRRCRPGPRSAARTASRRPRPRRTPAGSRPGRGRARPRPAPPRAAPGTGSRPPGSIHDQPSRSPAPDADEDAGELEQAVRQDQPEEQAEPVVRGHQPAGDADVERVLPEDPHHRQPGTPRARGDSAATQALLVATLRGERAGRRRRVVVLEVVLDQLPDLVRAPRWSPARAGRRPPRPPTTRPTRAKATPTATHHRMLR